MHGARENPANLFNPFEPYALAIGESRGDIAARKTGLALRHLFLRAAQGLPPGGAMRRARQGRVDDLLDRIKTQHEFGQLLPLQIIAQRFVIVHVVSSGPVIPGWSEGPDPEVRDSGFDAFASSRNDFVTLRDTSSYRRARPRAAPRAPCRRRCWRAGIPLWSRNRAARPRTQRSRS